MPSAKLQVCATHYDIYGPEDGDLIVLVHGIVQWSWVWTESGVVKFLVDKGYRVLTFDEPCRGQSGQIASGGVYDQQLYVDQVKQLTTHVFEQKLARKQKFIMMGHSMGGGITCLYANAHPEDIRATIFMAPAGLPINMPFLGKLMLVPGLGWALFKLIGQQVMLMRINKRLFVHEEFGKPDEVSEETIMLFQSHFLDIVNNKEGFLDSFHSVLSNFPFSTMHESYQSIGINHEFRVLSIWGDADAVVPFHNQKLLCELIPRAQTLNLPGIGHAIHFEESDWLTKLGDFLAKC